MMKPVREKPRSVLADAGLARPRRASGRLTWLQMTVASGPIGTAVRYSYSKRPRAREPSSDEHYRSGRTDHPSTRSRSAAKRP